ncbi:hypothetical protein EUGRSUZ_L01023 [Eucalyptus grandis]|uniref:Uncharacterized protein n=1 Tax=Eucalyptus grandis TaxID=71139 RepID=A0A058ZV35_EUCGR|nr:hypothetical protein EUGRSUZ_L01023 [Eucalyptus grandis]
MWAIFSASNAVSCVMCMELDNPAEPLINVEVVAHVMQRDLRSSEVSNKFYFTLTIHPEALNDGLRIQNSHPWKKRHGMSSNVSMLRVGRLHPEYTSPVTEANGNAYSQFE